MCFLTNVSTNEDIFRCFFLVQLKKFLLKAGVNIIQQHCILILREIMFRLASSKFDSGTNYLRQKRYHCVSFYGLRRYAIVCFFNEISVRLLLRHLKKCFYAYFAFLFFYSLFFFSNIEEFKGKIIGVSLVFVSA